MYNRRYTPERIIHLKENEIFVFGSNLAGSHGGGAARQAYDCFGAVWGQGVGLQGQSYAIPTMHGGVEAIKPYVEQFMNFAFSHREYTFLVTKIGCGIAAFTPYEIAPLFTKVIDLENVVLPEEFVEIIHNKSYVSGIPDWTWDSRRDFLNEYHVLMPMASKGDPVSYYKIKELRAREFRNTVELVNNGFYHTEEGDRIVLKDYNEMTKGTRYYSSEFSVDDICPMRCSTRVEVVNADCIYEGVRLLEMGYNPAILNMASRQNPGGGVTRGAGAQEETIFRRTNIFRSLYQFVPYAGQYGVKQSPFQYPMDRNFGGIYSPSVTIFREDERNGYKLMQTPRAVAFISVAGMNRPKLDNAGMIDDTLVEPIKNKMRTIFRIGLKHGHDSLVLGALGCGAFCNPPEHIARLFHEVMMEPEFANKYKLIVFAILEDHNSHRKHNFEGNFLPFQREFGNFLGCTLM